MTDKFAKLFEVGDKQVVFILSSNEEGDPCVSMYTKHKGVVLQLTPAWEDNDEGWDNAEEYFQSRTVEDAQKLIGVAKEQLGEIDD